LAGETYTGSIDLPAVCGAQHIVSIEAPGHQAQTLVLVAAVDAPVPIELTPMPPPLAAPAKAGTSRPSARSSSGASTSEGGPAVNLEANPF
jgi:hypothetical protein